MDTITQIQNYVSTMAALLAQHTEQLQQSPPITPEQFSNNVNFYYEGAPLVQERAQQFFERVVQADTLLASLPMGPYSEAEQLKLIGELEEQNRRAGERLNKAQQEAQVWQSRISEVLCESATYQLNSSNDNQR